MNSIPAKVFHTSLIENCTLERDDTCCRGHIEVKRLSAAGVPVVLGLSFTYNESLNILRDHLKKKRVNWSYLEVKTMLQIFDEHQIMAKLDGREFCAEQCYSFVATELQRSNYHRDASQVQMRFRAEKQKYRDYVRQQSKSGLDFTTLEHGTLLHKLLGDRPASRMVHDGVDSSRDSANKDCVDTSRDDDAIEEYFNEEWLDEGLLTGDAKHNIDVYQESQEDLSNCSRSQLKFTYLPHNIDRRCIPMPRTSLQRNNIALTAENPTLSQQNLSEIEQHDDVEPHLKVRFNATQRRKLSKIQAIQGNDQRPCAVNIGVQEAGEQLAPPRCRHPNAQQLENQDDHQPAAADNPFRLHADIDRQEAREHFAADHRRHPHARQMLDQNNHRPGVANNPGGRNRNMVNQALIQFQQGSMSLTDKAKGRKSYDNALANFQDKLSASQRALQQEQFEAHKKFWQAEVEAARQWKDQQLDRQRRHSEELVTRSNEVLVSAIDRLINGINMRPNPIISNPYPFPHYDSGNHGFAHSPQHYPMSPAMSSLGTTHSGSPNVASNHPNSFFTTPISSFTDRR